MAPPLDELINFEQFKNGDYWLVRRIAVQSLCWDFHEEQKNPQIRTDLHFSVCDSVDQSEPRGFLLPLSSERVRGLRISKRRCVDYQ